MQSEIAEHVAGRATDREEAARAPLDTRHERERVLDVALDVFQSPGYHAIGLREIARRAHVPFGTLHHVYPSKGALAQATVTHLHDQLRARLNRIEASHAESEDRLESLVEALIEVASEQGRRGCPVSCLLTHLRGGAKPAELEAFYRCTRYFDQLTGFLIRELGGCGFDSYDRENFANEFVAMWIGVTQRSMLSDDLHKAARGPSETMDRALRGWLAHVTGVGW